MPAIIGGRWFAEKIDYPRAERKTKVSGKSYRDWEIVSIRANRGDVAVATKPGVFFHGLTDTAAALLADHVRVVEAGLVVVMGSGNGLVPAILSREARSAQIVATDRNVLSVEATRRTLEANNASHATVVAQNGAFGIVNDGSADTVAIRIPQEKLALIQLLFDAMRCLRPGGVCYVAGPTNEGIKSAAKLLERVFGNATLLAYEGGARVLSATKTENDPRDPTVFESPFLAFDAFRELDVTLRGERVKLFTRPGVFSWDHLDEATEVLATHLDVPPRASILDLGCGCGPLGIVAWRLSEGGALTMVDADVEAVRSAAKSADAAGITDYRALPSDVAGAVINEKFDVVVTNPPFHVGKQTALSVPMQFIDDSWIVLNPGGRLFLVANRTLPYEAAVKQRFGSVSTVHDGRRFKILSAVKG